MTGTASEVMGELWSVYDLAVDRIPTHLPCARTQEPDRVLPETAAKWTAVADEAAALQAIGRPVLIGVRTVAAALAKSKPWADYAKAAPGISARGSGRVYAGAGRGNP